MSQEVQWPQEAVKEPQFIAIRKVPRLQENEF